MKITKTYNPIKLCDVAFYDAVGSAELRFEARVKIRSIVFEHDYLDEIAEVTGKFLTEKATRLEVVTALNKFAALRGQSESSEKIVERRILTDDKMSVAGTKSL